MYSIFLLPRPPSLLRPCPSSLLRLCSSFTS
jgi:hypothetical protein